MSTSWVGLSITTNKNKPGLNFHNSWWVGPFLLAHSLVLKHPNWQDLFSHIQHNITMAEEISRRVRAAEQQQAERIEEIFRRMRAVGQQQTERASGKWLFIYLCMHIYFLFSQLRTPLLSLGDQYRRRYFWPRQSSKTFWALFYTQIPKSTSIFQTKAIF